MKRHMALTEVAQYIGKGTSGIKLWPALAGGAALLGVRQEKKAKNSHFATVVKDRQVAVRLRMGRVRYDKWEGGSYEEWREQKGIGARIMRLAKVAKPKKEGKHSVYFAWPFTDAFRVVSTEPRPSTLGATRFRRDGSQWMVDAAIEWRVLEDLADRSFLNTTDLHESVRYECEQQIGIAAEGLTDEVVAGGLAVVSPALRAQLLETCTEPLMQYGVELLDVKTSYYGPSDMQVLASGGAAAIHGAIATSRSDEVSSITPLVSPN